MTHACFDDFYIAQSQHDLYTLCDDNETNIAYLWTKNSHSIEFERTQIFGDALPDKAFFLTKSQICDLLLENYASTQELQRLLLFYRPPQPAVQMFVEALIVGDSSVYTNAKAMREILIRNISAGLVRNINAPNLYGPLVESLMCGKHIWLLRMFLRRFVRLIVRPKGDRIIILRMGVMKPECFHRLIHTCSVQNIRSMVSKRDFFLFTHFGVCSVSKSLTIMCEHKAK